MDISPQQVKELRTITGAGLMDCKKALEANNGDMESSIEFLRKKGQITASKKSSRETKEGAIGIFSDESGKSWALFKLSCETDFVAKNENFVSLMDKIGGLLLNAKSADGFLESQTPDGTVQELITMAITGLGENIVLSECCKHEVGAGSAVSKYIHTNAKVGAIVELKTSAGGNPEVEQLGKDLCMQISAFPVAAVSEKDVPEEVIEKERRFLTEQALESGKPKEVVDKMVEGRLKKFRQEICLLDQAFVKDAGVSVKNHVDAVAKKVGSPIEVVSFIKMSV